MVATLFFGILDRNEENPWVGIPRIWPVRIGLEDEIPADDSYYRKCMSADRLTAFPNLCLLSPVDPRQPKLNIYFIGRVDLVRRVWKFSEPLRRFMSTKLNDENVRLLYQNLIISKQIKTKLIIAALNQNYYFW